MRGAFFSSCLFSLEEWSLFYAAVDIQQPLMLISRNNNDRKRWQICSFPLFSSSSAFSSECLCTMPRLPPPRPVSFPTWGLLLLSRTVPPSYPIVSLRGGDPVSAGCISSPALYSGGDLDSQSIFAPQLSPAKHPKCYLSPFLSPRH